MFTIIFHLINKLFSNVLSRRFISTQCRLPIFTCSCFTQERSLQWACSLSHKFPLLPIRYQKMCFYVVLLPHKEGLSMATNKLSAAMIGSTNGHLQHWLHRTIYWGCLCLSLAIILLLLLNIFHCNHSPPIFKLQGLMHLTMAIWTILWKWIMLRRW